VERPEVSQAALDLLLGYRWPGNIRELRNVAERIALKSVGQILRPADLPSEVLKPASQPESRGAVATAPAHSPQVEEMTQRMLRQGESFWSVVYPVFMSRDLTRDDLRRIVEIGLESTNGNYRLLVALYNMPNEDYKRFLGFLRKHNCHLPFQRFRTIPSRATSGNVPRASVAVAG
jgi:transcriptional regulator of acetoin/glycerol metabolism